MWIFQRPVVFTFEVLQCVCLLRLEASGTKHDYKFIFPHDIDDRASRISFSFSDSNFFHLILQVQIKGILRSIPAHLVFDGNGRSELLSSEISSINTSILHSKSLA